jgi:hypothetical protein
VVAEEPTVFVGFVAPNGHLNTILYRTISCFRCPGFAKLAYTVPHFVYSFHQTPEIICTHSGHFIFIYRQPLQK